MNADLAEYLIPSDESEVSFAGRYPEEFLVFRPLRTAVYAVLCSFTGKGVPVPWIYHLANVIGHSIAAALVFHVAFLLFQGQADSRKALWR